jgi:hypothetical protein
MDESIENSAVRGSSGGKKRAESLSKEERSAIASAAAKARWAKKKKSIVAIEISNGGLGEETIATAVLGDGSEISLLPIVSDPEEKHCPACLAGESLEEGEGEHILGTVEHPVTLPAAFADAETTVAVPEPPTTPPKHPKRQAKPMPAELKKASSYAERRLPKAVQEKADLIVELAKRETEIQELVRVLQALGGQVPAGIPPQRASYQPQLPPQYPEYQQNPIGVSYPPPVQTATPVDIPATPRRMIAGGARALDFSGIIND